MKLDYYKWMGVMIRKIFLVLFMGLMVFVIPLTVLSCHQNYEGFVDIIAHIIPRPAEPHESTTTFSSNLIVWFKIGVTENEAKHLIESFGLSKYKLSDPENWENAEHNGVAVVEVPSGSEDEYILMFRSNDMVLDAQLNVVYEP